MALISYVEPIALGDLFMGIATIISTIVICYIVYRIYIKFAQWIDVVVNRESKYLLMEEVFLDRIAKERDIDLDKELIKRDMLKDSKKKSFRRKIEEQIFKEMFGDEEEEI